MSLFRYLRQLLRNVHNITKTYFSSLSLNPQIDKSFFFFVTSQRIIHILNLNVIKLLLLKLQLSLNICEQNNGFFNKSYYVKLIFNFCFIMFVKCSYFVLCLKKSSKLYKKQHVWKKCHNEPCQGSILRRILLWSWFVMYILYLY